MEVWLNLDKFCSYISLHFDQPTFFQGGGGHLLTVQFSSLKCLLPVFRYMYVFFPHECMVFEYLRQKVRGSGGLVPSCPPP